MNIFGRKLGRVGFAEAQYIAAVGVCKTREADIKEVFGKLFAMADGGPYIIVRSSQGEYICGAVKWNQPASAPISFSTDKKCWAAIAALEDDGLDLVFP